MKNIFFLLAVAALALPLAGCCGYGLIYTHTVKPLDLDLDRTVNHIQSGEGDIKRFSYSVVDVAWDSNAIGDIAKADGIDEICFADFELLSVLGIWNQYTVHIYGKKSDTGRRKPFRP